MQSKLALYASVAALLILAGSATTHSQPAAAQSAAVQIDSDDIGGVVTSRFGPEAGVWVIAETTELGTRFAKMVVTDEVGRYVIPDLPKAKYRIWVRGYGLTDSPKVDAEPGKLLNLTAVIAPSLKDAAQYYPAIYWASMIRIADQSKFPGTGRFFVRLSTANLQIHLVPGWHQKYAARSRHAMRTRKWPKPG